ncbi:hypothetical protein ACFC0M_35375 [Streptomyces sp. NPDC056149]|uniref:hypothetical protein n=1 Tax=unclassified Streptomyces TaxID=2593676 RepID=UPI0023816A31|nr:hypothetical protein [Streptomyces sp. WZ-12]
MADQREPDAERERGRNEDRTRDEERGAAPTAPEADDSEPGAHGPHQGRKAARSNLFPTFSHRDD